MLLSPLAVAALLTCLGSQTQLLRLPAPLHPHPSAELQPPFPSPRSSTEGNPEFSVFPEHRHGRSAAQHPQEAVGGGRTREPPVGSLSADGAALQTKGGLLRYKRCKRCSDSKKASEQPQTLQCSSVRDLECRFVGHKRAFNEALPDQTFNVV